MAKPKEFVLSPQLQKVYDRLKEVRASKTVALKPSSFLKDQIVGFDGDLQPFKLRYYQVQGVFHMLMLKRMVLGDGTGLGKCQPAHTMILTDSGLDTLGSLAPKELDKTVEGFHSLDAPVKVWTGLAFSNVRRFYWGGRKACVRVTTRNGFEIEGSLVHPVWVRSEGGERFQSLVSLKSGDFICIDRYSPFPENVAPQHPSDKEGVPESILRGTRASVVAFLSDLFEGASVVDGHIEHTSTSKRLLQEVQLLLLRLGTVSCLKLVNGRWRLTLIGGEAERFRAQIGLPPRDNQLGQAFSTGEDTVPFASEILQSLHHKLAAVEGPEVFTQFGESFQSVLKGSRNPSYPWLHQFLQVCSSAGLAGCQEYAALEGLLNRRFFYDPIEKIETFETEVMDIEVDDPAHCFWANGAISHNTIESIATLAYLWEKEPANKVLIVAPKSATRQWAGEIARFTNNTRVLVAANVKPGKDESPVEARARLYQEWADAPTGPDDPKVVLITTYATLTRDWWHDSFQPTLSNGKPDKKAPVKPGLFDRISAKVCKDLVVIYDEASAFKNMRTKTWEVVRFLSDRSHRVYGLTATLLKNRLDEGFSIYKAIKPDLFGTKTSFLNDYCVVKLQPVAKRKVPIIVGYRNLDQFRARIDPFFLGRPKQAVSDELPSLTTREVLCEMSLAEDAKYTEALSGILELGDGDIREFEETKQLTSLLYCQQVVDSLSLLKFEEGHEVETGLAYEPEMHKVGKLGAKEQGLLDLLTGELEDEKVIVYTRFASLVGRLQSILTKAGIKSGRITGKESDKQRRAYQEEFQDLKSDMKVVFITDAGSEAINLQAAAATIFYDAPWSWGNYVQLLGRMIRIGSPHQKVLAFHLIAERPRSSKADRKTIDHHVLSLLRAKKGLIDQVLGEAAVGALTFESSQSVTRDLVSALLGDAA